MSDPFQLRVVRRKDGQHLGLASPHVYGSRAEEGGPVSIAGGLNSVQVFVPITLGPSGLLLGRVMRPTPGTGDSTESACGSTLAILGRLIEPLLEPLDLLQVVRAVLHLEIGVERLIRLAAAGVCDGASPCMALEVCGGWPMNLVPR